MAFYVTADLHLSEHTGDLNEAFARFLSQLKSGDKLIIAGDLFDFFVGIDPADKAQAVVKDAVSKARHAGISVMFIQGNRDFLIRKKEADYFGFTLLPDYHVIKAPYGNVLIMHGDALCSNDLKYQRFKRRCRNPWLQHLFLLLPLGIRRQIGLNIRSKSKNAAFQRTNSKIYGAVPQTIERVLQAFNCSYLVHGHLHLFHRYTGEGAAETARLSLGCWGYAFSYVRLDGNGLAHVQKPLTALLGD